MFTIGFWRDVTERALKTFAQALVAMLAVGTPIFDIAWVEALGVAATAMVVSVLTSIASEGIGEDGSASLLTDAYRGRHRGEA
ncbi:holin [Corynebacterium sphenisci]|uniref:holin n=1 Tax=Corynebacterium sphenisci TaxID=191493 RepID=UPI0026E09B64|nr:holin [Corynebacterium sphenisci]MDO5730763.1 holin [Corynebacterium sphenisci]